MDMNHYDMYQDPRMTSRSEQNDESTLQWSHNVCSEGSAQWQHSYDIDQVADYSMRPQASYNRQPTALQPPPPRYQYHPMNSVPYNQAYPADGMNYQRIAPGPINPGPMGPHQPMGPRPMGPRPMGHPMYQSVGYSFNHPPVLRQLHPSNEQLCSVPEMQGMRQSARQRFDAPPAQKESPVKPSYSPAKASRPGQMGLQQSPLKSPAFEMTAAKPPVKRPFKGTNSSPSASPQKKVAGSKISPRKTNPKPVGRSVKENTPPSSPAKESKEKSKPRVGATRFISASVVDVLRWKRQDYFSAFDRATLAIEVVGTVFDISGSAPVNITIHSQDNLSGVYWETDFPLDRSVLLPGCVVRVVLRIPSDGKDFHFLKVSPLAAPPGSENAFRRICYVTTTVFEQAFKKF